MDFKDPNWTITADQASDRTLTKDWFQAKEGCKFLGHLWPAAVVVKDGENFRIIPGDTLEQIKEKVKETDILYQHECGDKHDDALH